MAERVFALPDLGEGLEEATITAWLVKEGDPVSLNQPIVEVETTKATVEIPSPFAGAIDRVHGKVGETVKVGAPLVTFEVEDDGEAAAEEGAGPATVPATRRRPARRRGPGSGRSPTPRPRSAGCPSRGTRARPAC